MPELTSWQSLRLLTWKNFIILWNNPRELLVDLLLPAIFWLALIILRIKVDPRQIEEFHFKAIDFEASWKQLIELIETRRELLKLEVPNFSHSIFVPQLIIAYAPSDYKDFEMIMNSAIKILGSVTLLGFHTCRALRKAMESQHYLAGVCFHDIVTYDYGTGVDFSYEIDENDKMENLNYTIVMPSEFRIYDDSIVGASWSTNRIFSFRSDRMVHGSGKVEYTPYTREGFVPLQDAINRGFLKYALNDDTKVPEITLQRFPYPAHYHDEAITTVPLALGLLVVLGFLCPVIRITWLISHEKLHEVKSYLLAIGVKNWTYYLSWYILGLFIFCLNAIVLLFVLMLRWNQNYSMLTQTSSIAFFVLLLPYCIYASAYTILIATLFESDFVSAIVAGSFWIISTIPVISFSDHRRIQYLEWIFFYLLPNSTMGLMAFRIIDAEVSRKGFDFSDFFERTFPFVEINGSEVGIICLAHAAIYMFVLIRFGTHIFKCTQSWGTFNSQLISSSKRRAEKDPILHKFETEETKVFEIEAVYRKQLASIEGVSKVYNNKEVVKNVSLNLYENNITILLGHNGSGKTTLLRMISGLEPLTRGNISIQSTNSFFGLSERSNHIGASIRDSLLFDDLTVENHILFYSRLKGMTWLQAKFQVVKYCDTMDLIGKRNEVAKKLTSGLRHQLAVCCALTGDSKIVIMDEPNYGMDETATRNLMELLEAEKKNRAILLSTNSTRIADSIADRVAIMAKGEIKCSGSIVFLKNIYTFGQRLSIIKARVSQTARITQFLQKFMPDIVVESDLGYSLNYLINDRYTNIIGAILENMEKEFDKLGIETYALDDLSIDDVVMSIGTNYPNDKDPHRQTRILNGETPYGEAAYEAFGGRYLTQSNPPQQFRPLVLAHLILLFRNKWETISTMLLPACSIGIMYVSSGRFMKRVPLPALKFTPENYENSFAITGYQGKPEGTLYYIYQCLLEAFFWLPHRHKAIDIHDTSIVEFVLEKQRRDMGTFNRENLMGMSYADNSIKVFFNSVAYHSGPMALNMAYNSIARALIDKFSTITVTLFPLPYATEIDSVPLLKRHNVFITVLLTIIFSLVFCWNISVYYITVKRSKRFWLLLKITGASTKNIWLCTFMFDMLRNFIVICSVVLAVYACFHELFNAEMIGYTLMTLTLGCITIHSIHYVFARLSDLPIMCYNTVFVYDCIGIIVFTIMAEIEKVYVKNEEYQTADRWFLLHPYYAMGKMLLIVMVESHRVNMCRDPGMRIVLTYLKDDKRVHCDSIPPIFSKEGILLPLISLVTLTFFSWLLITIIENNKKWFNFWVFSINRDSIEPSWEDYMRLRTLNEPDDVERERIELEKKTPIEKKAVPLVMDRVGKTFGLFEALHRMCIVLERSSICSVLGADGSGKSLLLNLINTDMRLSYGQILVMGVNVSTDFFNVYKHIGYSSGKMEALEMFTACEVMEIFATLRGIPEHKKSTVCESIAKVLGFFDDYDQLICICGLGVQVRVSCALALLGEPDLILLDEPSTAIDTYGKLLLRKALSNVTRNGSTVLFASTSPQVCQLFCDKILIISSGRLRACGTIQDVLNRGYYGYDLIIRLKPLHMVGMHSKRHQHGHFTTSDVVKFQLVALVQNSFENVILRHVGDLLLSFMIPHGNSVSMIYSTIKANAFIFHIESFGIFRSSLDSIYLKMYDKHMDEWYG